MAMDRINDQNLIRQGLVDKYKGTQRSKDAGKGGQGQEAAQNNPTRSVKPADSVQISEAARKMVDLREAVDTGRTAMENLPEIREDKVAQARQRLEQGFYNSTEVKQEVAGKLSQVIDEMDQL
jgi:anti-sigma28 factor (negative regulator of flagellin synthesis)